MEILHELLAWKDVAVPGLSWAVAKMMKDIAVPGCPCESLPVEEKAKDVAVPGSSAVALSVTGPLAAAAEKDVAVPASSAVSSSGPALVSYTGVPLPKQQTEPPASALKKVGGATQGLVQVLVGW